MASSIVPFPSGYYPDPVKGRPLFNAKIYVGVVDLDPRIVANQITVVGRQESGTEVTLEQPIRTNSGGVPIDGSSNVVTMLIDGDYAMAVDSSGDDQQYFFENTSALINFGNQPVLSVETVEDLRSFEPSFDGQVIELVGHTESGVGGGPFINEVGSSEADNNGSVVVTVLGSRWIRPFSSDISVEEFGALSVPIDEVPTFDSSTSINAALLYAKENNIFIVSFSRSRSYGLESTILKSLFVSIHGNNARLIVLENASFISAVAIATNTLDGVTQEIESTTNSGRIQDLIFDNRDFDVTGAQGIGLCDSSPCINIRSFGMYGTYKTLCEAPLDAQKIDGMLITLHQGNIPSITIEGITNDFSTFNRIHITSLEGDRGRD